MKTKVFNLIIVDESGSMSIIRDQAFAGMNETLLTIKNFAQQKPEIEQRVVLLTFDSTHPRFHYDNAEEGIRGLLNIEIEAYVDDESEVEFAMEKHKGQVKTMQVVIRSEEYGFAFRLGNAEAKAAADRVIEAKRRNGDLQALFRKYTSIYKTIGLDGI